MCDATVAQRACVPALRVSTEPTTIRVRSSRLQSWGRAWTLIDIHFVPDASTQRKRAKRTFSRNELAQASAHARGRAV